MPVAKEQSTNPMRLRRGPETMRIELLASMIDEGLLGIRETIWHYAKSFAPRTMTKHKSDPWSFSTALIGDVGNDAVAVWDKSDGLVMSRGTSGDTIMTKLPGDVSMEPVLYHNGVVYSQVKHESKLQRWSCDTNKELEATPVECGTGMWRASGDYLFCLTGQAGCLFYPIAHDTIPSEWSFWFKPVRRHVDSLDLSRVW